MPIAMYHRSLHDQISTSKRVMKAILSSKESEERYLHDNDSISVIRGP